MSDDDVLYGYRLRLFALAGEVGVRAACRTMGVHHSTYYRWKPLVERAGLEMLRPRERRRPQMPNQLSPLVEQRIVAFALGQPGLGPKRIAAQLARPEWGGLVVSPNGVYKTLVRHGLNTRAKRLALVAGYRARFEPAREPEPEPHIDTERPGELVGMDCFFVGRLHGAAGPVWQITAIDCHTAPTPGPTSSSARPEGPRSSTPRSSPAASPPSSSSPTGSSNACSPTTAASSAAAPSRSGCQPASSTARSAPGGRRPTGTSSDSTARSSTSAGALPSPASSRSATAASSATSTATCATTTTSAHTPAASPTAAPQQTSSTPPEK